MLAVYGKFLSAAVLQFVFLPEHTNNIYEAGTGSTCEMGC